MLIRAEVFAAIDIFSPFFNPFPDKLLGTDY